MFHSYPKLKAPKAIRKGTFIREKIVLNFGEVILREDQNLSPNDKAKIFKECPKESRCRREASNVNQFADKDPLKNSKDLFSLDGLELEFENVSAQSEIRSILDKNYSTSHTTNDMDYDYDENRISNIPRYENQIDRIIVNEMEINPFGFTNERCNYEFDNSIGSQNV